MDTTVMTIITAVGAGLATAVGALWKQSKTREAEDRAKESLNQERYHKQQDNLLLVTKEVGELSGKISIAQGIDPKLDSIEKLMNQVVKEVTKESKESK